MPQTQDSPFNDDRVQTMKHEKIISKQQINHTIGWHIRPSERVRFCLESHDTRPTGGWKKQIQSVHFMFIINVS